MAKQSLPKVSELVEVLLQQQHKSDKINTKINEGLVTLTDIMRNSKLRVDTSELRKVEEDSREKRQIDFELFHGEIKKNNKELLIIHKAVSSKRLLYIIILNIILLFTTGLSTYVAIKNSIIKSDFELLAEDHKELNNQIDNVKTFFSENPKTFSFYQKWNKNQ